MNSPEAARPRRWFQLHLSTCVVMMFAASGIVWMNLHAYDPYYPAELDTPTARLTIYYGWPVPVMHQYPIEGLDSTVTGITITRGTVKENYEKYLWSKPEYDLLPGVPLNLVCWLVILLLTAWGWEYLIRRRGSAITSGP